MGKFKQKLLSMIPSYRMGNAIQRQNEAAQQQLMKRMEQLDEKTEYLFWLSQQREGELMQETKRRVFLAMPKAEGATWIKQRANLLLLRELKRVCDENRIRFSLAMGTLLGAVRHHGFVPWDDDVDVCMLREDFIRLADVLKDHDMLKLETCFDPHLGYRFLKLKLRRSETFFVDIFVLDRFDADEATLESRYEELKKANARFVLSTKEIMRRHGSDGWQTVMPQEHSNVQRETQAVFSSICKELPYYGKGEYLCVGIDGPTFIRNQAYVYRCDEMLPFVKDALVFEGETFDSVRNPDLWLHNAYGDYWSLPKALRPGHPELSAMDEADLALLTELGVIRAGDIAAVRALDALKVQF